MENRIDVNFAQWTGAGIHESGILGDARLVNNVILLRHPGEDKIQYIQLPVPLWTGSRPSPG